MLYRNVDPKEAFARCWFRDVSPCVGTWRGAGVWVAGRLVLQQFQGGGDLGEEGEEEGGQQQSGRQHRMEGGRAETIHYRSSSQPDIYTVRE